MPAPSTVARARTPGWLGAALLVTLAVVVSCTTADEATGAGSEAPREEAPGMAGGGPDTTGDAASDATAQAATTGTDEAVVPAGTGDHGVGADPLAGGDHAEALSAAASGYSPFVAEASEEASAALRSFTVAEGLAVSLVAAEPLLANPVCLALDEQGALYVGETFRHGAGVADIRDHMDWLDDDLAAATVEDRRALLRRHEGEAYDDYAEEHDRVRRLVDVDGDGRFDRATVFADGFDDHAAGIGAGLLALDGEVFYTCIPELWALRDTDGDGVADERDVLSEGYGAKIGFLGHDLHGLALGPDGRLYFSIGDRGLSVETPGGRLHLPDTGCVLRCERDGSGLEIVHRGLRNPQELAFDDFGNLFTGDNNADAGDLARWVVIVEEGDSGWRQAYQFLPERGPWKDERIWRAGHYLEQPAFHLPPLAHVASGPSGLCAATGTGLDPDSTGTFFLCDFLGVPGSSGVLRLEVEAEGASFRLASTEQVLWGLLATDVEPGPDGSLYVSDWVGRGGWSTAGKGRVYRLGPTDPEAARAGAETAAILAGGMGQRSVHELSALLRHADRRVRLAAQPELVEGGDEGRRALERAVHGGPGVRTRLAGLWGLGILGRRGADVGSVVRSLLTHHEPELRAHASRLVGELGLAAAAQALAVRLADESPRVRLFAAQGAARLAWPGFVEALVAQARRDGHDPTLRHGTVTALARCAEDAALRDLVEHPDVRVRMACLLAMRRRGQGDVARFLKDDDPVLVVEAARAIHDRPRDPTTGADGIEEAAPHLAALVDAPLMSREVLGARLASSAWRRAVARADDATTPAGEAAAADADEHDEVESDEGASSGGELDPSSVDRLHGALVRRVIAANLRLGGDDQARALVRLARREQVDEALRAEALDVLTDWGDPSDRDLVLGRWRPVAPRDDGVLPALADDLADAMGEAPETLRRSWCRLVARVGRASHADLPRAWLADRELEVSTRSAALETLETLGVDDLQRLVTAALADPEADLRAAALSALERLDPALALPRVPDLLETGELAEQRVALGVLGRVEEERAQELLVQQLDRLDAGRFPDELALDLVTACEARGVAALDARLEQRVAARLEVDEALGPWLDGLHGGEVEAGRELFERTELQCRRCHASAESEAPQVGPDLTDVGRRLARVQLLESIVDPNRRVAPGYAATHLFLADGSLVTGRVLEEDAHGLVVQDAEGELHEVEVAAVDERRSALSAMPEGLTAGLTRHEMRDLLAYLAQL